MTLESGKVKEVRLRCWEEAVGQCRAVEQGEFGVSVLLGNLRVVFPDGSPEAEMLRKTVNDGWIGKKIGLLRTNVPQTPLLARLIE